MTACVNIIFVSEPEVVDRPRKSIHIIEIMEMQEKYKSNNKKMCMIILNIFQI